MILDSATLVSALAVTEKAILDQIAAGNGPALIKGIFATVRAGIQPTATDAPADPVLTDALSQAIKDATAGSDLPADGVRP